HSPNQSLALSALSRRHNCLVRYNSARNYLDQVLYAYERDDANMVITTITMLLDTGMYLAEAYEYRAWGYFKTRAYRAAITDGKRAIDMGSSNPETPLVLGRSYIELNNYAAAIGHLKQAIDLDYDPLQEVHFYRAQCYELLGKTEDEVKAEWEQTLKLGRSSYWGTQAQKGLDKISSAQSSQKRIKKEGTAYSDTALGSIGAGFFGVAMFFAMFLYFAVSAFNSGAYVGMLIMGMLTFLILLLGLTGVFSIWDVYQLGRNGKNTTGTITRKYIKTVQVKNKTREAYTISYHYGDGIQATCEIRKPVYDKVVLGQTITIKYLPHKPDVSSPCL
ncbi:tetratricopeptide repeat protein, partial [Anaerolineales bacterium HSG25]|nr:tetratricopeptide repeat protein [Anaerolineales bacterium HSG25]